jgi:hypothetical protein
MSLAVAATAPRYTAASDAAKAVTPPAHASCASAKSKAHAASKTCAASKARAAPTATAADAASTAAAPSASSASSTTTTAAAAATAATSDELYAGSQCCGVFSVKDVERRQADVGDFLLGESDFVAHSSVRRRHIRRRPTGCAAGQRERQTGGPQRRQSFASELSLRSLLRARHRATSTHPGNVQTARLRQQSATLVPGSIGGPAAFWRSAIRLRRLFLWRARRDSNSRPSDSKSDALSS